MDSLPSIELDHTGIVVLGNFNPAIFSTAWLRAQGLISQAQADAAVVKLITPDIALFHIGLVDLDVQRQRLALATLEISESERMRDLAVGILRTLSHTPVGALGINRAVHLKLDSIEQYHRFGDRLAPKSFWETFLQTPGMLVSAIRGLRPDEYVGWIQVQVEPSSRVAPPALFIQHNDHYALRRGRVVEGRDDPSFLAQNYAVEPTAENVVMVIEILERDWGNALDRSHTSIEKIWNFASQKEGA